MYDVYETLESSLIIGRSILLTAYADNIIAQIVVVRKSICSTINDCNDDDEIILDETQ